MCQKIGYKNFSRALRHMQKMNRKYGFDLKRIYECPVCGQWHLTSKEMK